VAHEEWDKRKIEEGIFHAIAFVLMTYEIRYVFL
jgi:hypothetical protein